MEYYGWQRWREMDPRPNRGRFSTRTTPPEYTVHLGEMRSDWFQSWTGERFSVGRSHCDGRDQEPGGTPEHTVHTFRVRPPGLGCD